MPLVKRGYWRTATVRAFRKTEWLSRKKVLGTLGLAAIAPFLQWKLFNLRTWQDSWKIVFTVIVAYILVAVASFINNLITEPAVIDHERQIEINALSSQVEEIKRSSESNIQQLTQRHQETVKNLNTELARKRPLDVVKEQDVRGWLSYCSAEETRFIKWLLNQGEVPRDQLRQSTVNKFTINAVLQKLTAKIIKIREQQRGASVDRFVQINPEYKDALTNVLHPW